MKTNEKYIPVKDYAHKKNISVQAVYKQIKLNKIKSKKIGNYILVIE